MTASTMARRHTAAGPNPKDQPRMLDTDIHHLFDLIRDDHIRFTQYQHTDLTGTNIDDLVYAAEEAGLVAVHPAGVIKTTEAGRDWRSRNHRAPAIPEIVFQQSEVA